MVGLRIGGVVRVSLTNVPCTIILRLKRVTLSLLSNALTMISWVPWLVSTGIK